MDSIDIELPFLTDCTNLPIYVVDTVIRRDLGGMASIINCRKCNGVIVPLCEIIISNQHLIEIGTGARDFALEMLRRHQMVEMVEMIGARH